MIGRLRSQSGQTAKESAMDVQTSKLVHPDIKPENPPERAAHYLDVPNMPWEKTKFPGIAIKVLYSDDSGITTALFKLDPGAASIRLFSAARSVLPPA